MPQNKKGAGNDGNGRNSAYYRSKARKNRRPSANADVIRDRGKTREMNTYLRVAAILVIFVLAAGALIWLGLRLGDIANGIPDDETTGDTSGGQTEPSLASTTIPEATTAAVIPPPPDSHIYAYIDIMKLSGLDELRDVAASARRLGATIILLDIKREDGFIPYLSSEVSAAVAGAVHENPDVPIGDALSLLHEDGFRVAGMLSCFKDDLAATSFPSYSLIQSSNMLRWSDSNGSYWLNMYVEGARNYIKGLALEAASLGFDEIILSQFFLPNVSNTADIFYNGGEVSRYEIVRDFVVTLRLALEDQSPGVLLGLNIPVQYMLSAPNDTTGLDPAELIGRCAFITSNFIPAQISTTVPINGSVFTNPAASPYATVHALCAQTAYIYAADTTKMRPMLQFFDSGGNVYSQVELDAQIFAINEYGMYNMMFINYDNKY